MNNCQNSTKKPKDKYQRLMKEFPSIIGWKVKFSKHLSYNLIELRNVVL